MHPKFQGTKYRSFRALIFVATGLFGLAPLIHGLNVFGILEMMRKAFPYTLAKAGCLLSGTSFYAVSPIVSHTWKKSTLTHMVLRLGFPKVDILANSTYGAPIRSFTSWWYAPLWSSWWGIWMPSTMLTQILLARLFRLCIHAEYGASSHWARLHQKTRYFVNQERSDDAIIIFKVANLMP